MQRWDDTLYLFTVEEFEQIPDGTELHSIMKDIVIKGKDEIDLDTRAGHLAYGVHNPATHELAGLFTMFKLRG